MERERERKYKCITRFKKLTVDNFINVI